MVRPIIPMVGYIINQDYISEFLCINKEKPELQCEGKCYLMQMLEEQQDGKKENLPKIAMEEYPIGFVELYHLRKKVIPKREHRYDFGYTNLYKLVNSRNIFHPPRHIC